jgi:hypothetical protein
VSKPRHRNDEVAFTLYALIFVKYGLIMGQGEDFQNIRQAAVKPDDLLLEKI